METAWSVAIFEQEQPDPAVWARLVAVVDAWNASGAGPVIGTTVPYARYARFERADAAAKDRYLAQLDAVAGAALHVVMLDELEEADYTVADFVAVSGAPVDVVVNETAALVDAGPCPDCGAHDVLDVDQVTPVVIDQQRALAEAPGLALDLAGRGLALTRAQADAWELAGLRGAELRPLLDAATGLPSTHYAQLAATTAVLTPCAGHTRVRGLPHCTGCGRARGQVEGWFTVPRDAAGELDVISRHPNRISLLLLSPRAREVLGALGSTGLSPYDAIRLCEQAHPADEIKNQITGRTVS